MPGGAALVGIADTEHPEEVARVLDFLAQEEQLAEFYGRTLFIPGHLGLAESGVEFDAELQQTRDALSVFASQVPKLHPTTYALQGYQYNRVIFDTVRDRLTQVFVGELTLDQAIERMQQDIDDQIAEAQ
jgi:alpha-1,4-digalacturonate transport system substrate-binding protein